MDPLRFAGYFEDDSLERAVLALVGDEERRPTLIVPLLSNWDLVRQDPTRCYVGAHP